MEEKDVVEKCTIDASVYSVVELRKICWMVVKTKQLNISRDQIKQLTKKQLCYFLGKQFLNRTDFNDFINKVVLPKPEYNSNVPDFAIDIINYNFITDPITLNTGTSIERSDVDKFLEAQFKQNKDNPTDLLSGGVWNKSIKIQNKNYVEGLNYYYKHRYGLSLNEMIEQQKQQK